MMKRKMITIAVALLAVIGAGCNKDGCSDQNADNFDSKANKSSNCMYRYSSAIEVSGVPSMRPGGGSWDGEGNLPDLKMVFFKNQSGHVDVVSSIAMDATAATLTTPETLFTNGDWQYELMDDDGDASELIASGHFNPLKDGSDGHVRLTNGSISIQFNYTVK